MIGDIIDASLVKRVDDYVFRKYRATSNSLWVAVLDKVRYERIYSAGEVTYLVVYDVGSDEVRVLKFVGSVACDKLEERGYDVSYNKADNTWIFPDPPKNKLVDRVVF